MSHAKRRHLRGQGKVVREQFRRKGVNPARDPDRKLRLQLLRMAQDSLETAALWCKKKELVWALVTTERALKLLGAARSL